MATFPQEIYTHVFSSVMSADSGTWDFPTSTILLLSTYNSYSIVTFKRCCGLLPYSNTPAPKGLISKRWDFRNGSVGTNEQFQWRRHSRHYFVQLWLLPSISFSPTWSLDYLNKPWVVITFRINHRLPVNQELLPYIHHIFFICNYCNLSCNYCNLSCTSQLNDRITRIKETAVCSL